MRALALALLVAATASVACERSETDEAPAAAARLVRPNVLLIVVDTLRRDRLGVYGHHRPTSPSLDALAAQGMRYDHAVSQAPWTLPSLASLLTSRYPSQLGIADVDTVVPESALLLPELLQTHGYATGAVVSHRFAAARWGFRQGYDVFDETSVLDHDAVTSPAVSNAAIAFLDRHDERPFFLLLHYFDPHSDYREHAGFELPREAPYRGPIESGMARRELLALRRRLRAADVAELLRIYDSEIAFTDHHIGRVLDALRERGLYDRTIVVATADHGEEFLDHGHLGHTKTLYEELIRVPLLVRHPGWEPGVVSTPVALLDVLPSVAQWVGFEAPDDIEGRVLPRRDEESAAARNLISETERPRSQRAVVRGTLKWVDDAGRGRSALYDLGTDPGERTNLKRRRPDAARALAAALAEHAARVAALGTEPARVEISERDADALRALGYVDDAGEASD